MNRPRFAGSFGHRGDTMRAKLLTLPSPLRGDWRKFGENGSCLLDAERVPLAAEIDET
jgi:hypothetical protein